ncbi:hypothetical protein [Empedobacter sp. GD03797]|uniref:hypothetical protein n=1 Tax=Empedobacter sp. GD03797 TaxID=2975382 RepID=UPI00244965E6|nr:hypothetical protein [Empedobacter sp. GD03797]MDH1882064.1 hypothetical protein [Empedobacter sp. GD03797]
MKITLSIIVFCLHSILFSQQIEELNRILKIDSLKLHENEIRIYKKYATSTALEMFRLYNVKDDYWKAELYQTKAGTINNVTKIRIVKEKLNSLSNLELIWFKILDTDILYLPDFDKISYKLKNKSNQYSIEEGNIVNTTKKTSILDGVSYYILINSNKKKNTIHYLNPENYLEYYPNVDELISVKELLDLIRLEFGCLK